MKFLEYLESRHVRRNRATAEDLETLAELAKRELRESEKEVRQKVSEVVVNGERMALARAMGRWEPDSDK